MAVVPRHPRQGFTPGLEVIKLFMLSSAETKTHAQLS